MEIIVDEMWPEVAIRLRHLDSRGLVPIIDLVDHWIRLSKDGWGLRSTPNKLQHRVAKRFIKTLVPSVVDATRHHPGAQVRLRDLTDRTKLRIAHPTLDPEFAFLMVNDLRRPRDGEKGFVEHRVQEFAEHWAEEDPATLTERIGRWSEEARLVERDLHPGLPWVVRAMLERIEGVERIDGLVVGGLDAGLTYELADLMAASVQRSADLPPWFERALSSPARRQAVAAGIQQDGNRPAALAALAALDDRDMADLAYLVPMKDPDWVTLELLKHANDNIRGTAALQFSFGPRDRSPEVPADWRQTWSDAFEVAPLESRRTHDGWRLGEHLRRLVDEGPELVERWLTRQIAADPLRAFLSLPSGFEPALERLPEESRLRLMERFAKEYVGSELLGKLLGSDSPFLGRLLDEGTVELEDAVTALRYIQGTDEEPRIDRVLKHAPILLRRGVQPEDIAYATVMSSGVYTGPESGHWDRWRAEFESRLATADPEVRPVIEACLRVSIAERDHALKEERQKRIAGRL
jgi:hypothetical protein